MFPSWLQKRLFGYETYIRVYPPLPPGRREKGLFEGLNGQDKA